MESNIIGCGKFNRSKDKDLIESRSALLKAWIDDVERAVEKVDKNLPDMMARHIVDICYRESERLKKHITMERKIGEVFEYNGEWYQCVEQSGCGACSFRKNDTICHSLGCSELVVRDSTPVIFKKLEKVGEPYAEGNSIVSERMFQRYRLYEKNFFLNERDLLFTSYGDIVSIEIKQTKEDMEEKEPTYEELLHYYHSTVGLWAIDKSPQEVSLDWICDNAFQLGIDEKDSNSENIGKNLREFDLEAAKSGKPVCTRDGRKARIICFDRRLFYKNVSYPILAVVERSDGEDDVCGYNEKGKVLIEDGAEYKDDLMMLPEKKEGWINLYRNEFRSCYINSGVYSSKQEAYNHINNEEDYLDTIKISWEE